jgi:hypothetical protein
MNDCETKSCCNGRGWTTALVAVAACLIFAALVFATKKYTQPEPLGSQRAAERAKARAELTAAESEALDHVGWVDQTKGIVRLPIAVAMNLALEESQNPAQARKDLIARVDKATAVPPKAPEKPSQFE